MDSADSFEKLQQLTHELVVLFPALGEEAACDLLLLHNLDLHAAVNAHLAGEKKTHNASATGITSPASKAQPATSSPSIPVSAGGRSSSVNSSLLDLDFDPLPPASSPARVPQGTTNLMDLFGDFDIISPTPSPAKGKTQPAPSEDTRNSKGVSSKARGSPKAVANALSPIKGEISIGNNSPSFRGSNRFLSSNVFAQKSYGEAEIAAATKIQSVFRRIRWVRCVEKIGYIHKHRKSVVKEILSSEKSYVSQLSDIVNVFIAPAIVQKLLDQSSVDRLFSNIRLLAETHSLLLTKFSEKMKTWSPRERISDIFLELIPSMSVYQEYVNGFRPNGLQSVMDANKKFAKYVKQTHSKDNHSGPSYLSSLLVAPIQRIPRLELLLKELLKFTPHNHEDHEGLSEAYNGVKNVNKSLNKKRGKSAPLREHNFRIRTYKYPSWCYYCDEFIWGVSRQGYRCKSCREAIHKKCFNMALDSRTCTGVRKLPSKKVAHKHRVKQNSTREPETGTRKAKTRERGKSVANEAKTKPSVADLHSSAEKTKNLGEKKAPNEVNPKQVEKDKKKEEKELKKREKLLAKEVKKLKSDSKNNGETGENQEELSPETENAVQWVQKLKKAPRGRFITIVNQCKLISCERGEFHESRGKWRRKPAEFIYPDQAIQFGVEGKLSPEGYCLYSIDDNGKTFQVKFMWGSASDGAPTASFTGGDDIPVNIIPSYKMDIKFCDIKFEFQEKKQPTSTVDEEKVEEVEKVDIPTSEDSTPAQFEGMKLQVSDSDSDSDYEDRTSKLIHEIKLKPADTVKEVDPETLLNATKGLSLGSSSSSQTSNRRRGRRNVTVSSTSQSDQDASVRPSEDESNRSHQSEFEVTEDESTYRTEDDTMSVRTEITEDERTEDNRSQTEDERVDFYTETDDEFSTPQLSIEEIETKTRTHVKNVFALLEQGKFMDGLSEVNEALYLFAQLPDPSTKKKEIQICRYYKVALKLLISKVNELNMDVVALWTRALAELPLLPKHRLVCVRMTIKANLEVGNFGVAAKFIQMILPLNLKDKAEQEAQLERCKQNELQDSGISVNSQFLLCNHTLEVIKDSTYFQCQVCDAVFSAEIGQSGKCTFCSSDPLIEKSL